MGRGYDGCWVGALTCPMEFFTEPIMLGVIAIIEAWPRPKQSGRNIRRTEKLRKRIVDNAMLTVDNYTQFLTDLK